MKHALEVVSLGRLIETAVIKRSARNAQLIQRFGDARWIEPTGRKEEWRVRDVAISKIEARMDELFPFWRQEFQFLRSHGLNPFDPRSIESLGMLRKQKVIVGMINRRNWNAATGLGPKHTSQERPSAILTKDWVMRFKPNNELCGIFGGNEINLWRLSETLSECVIPERLWLKFERFVGVLPNLIVTCENLGAYVDLPMPDGVMAVYAPGADIEATAELLKHFSETKWIHFGDVDPDGLKIAENLAREVNRQLTVFVPSFADEYLPGRPVKTPWEEVPDTKIFRELKRERTRLFQEVFMLDARLNSEIAEILSAARKDAMERETSLELVT